MRDWLARAIARSRTMLLHLEWLTSPRVKQSRSLAAAWEPGRCIICDGETEPDRQLCGVGCFVLWCWRRSDPQLSKLLACAWCGAELSPDAQEAPTGESAIVCGMCREAGKRPSAKNTTPRQCVRPGCNRSFVVRWDDDRLACPRCRWEHGDPETWGGDAP